MAENTRPGAETLKSLREGDVVLVTLGSNARAQRLTVTFDKSERFVGLVGARGGAKTLVPSTCGRAVQLTTVSGQREWVSKLEVA